MKSFCSKCSKPFCETGFKHFKQAGLLTALPQGRHGPEIDLFIRKQSLLNYLDGTVMEVRFIDGQVKRYDIAVLFDKYPQFMALKNKELFQSGKLMGPYGIIWTDDLDLETETIYQDGVTVRNEPMPVNMSAARAVSAARAQSGLSQKETGTI